jgi:hypothetical protein
LLLTKNALLQDSLRKYIQTTATTRPTLIQADEQGGEAFESFKEVKSQAIFNEVKNMATLYLNKYLGERPDLLQDKDLIDECFDQWIWVYQILLLPQSVLQELLFKSNDKQSKTHFRKLCILVHPDKNTHELASKAFQRLLSVFQQGA